MSPLYWVGGATVLGAFGAGEVVLLHQLRVQKRVRERLQAIRRPDGATMAPTQARQQPQASVFASVIGAVGSGIMRLLSQKTVAGLQQTLGKSGLRGSQVLALFVGAKLVLVLTMPLLALAVVGHLHLSPMTRNGAIAGAAMLGLLGPDWWVRRRHKKYLDAVLTGLPDALDLMVICSEAGLPLEPTIARVAAEIEHAHPAVAEELRQTATELRILSDRRTALHNMGSRTGLESLKRLGTTLVQTMQYGTPLSQALRTLSAEMRTEMLTRFEARAARLPVLLTVPMIVFILPTVFAVVGGPAMLKALQSVHH